MNPKIDHDLLHAATAGAIIRRPDGSVRAVKLRGHGGPMRWMHLSPSPRTQSDDEMATHYCDPDDRLVYPADHGRDEPVSAKTNGSPLTEWLEQTETGDLRERVHGMKLSAILELVKAVDAEQEDARRQADLHRARVEAFVNLRDRIVRAATIEA